MSKYLKEITLLYVEDSFTIRELFARKIEDDINKLIVAVDGEDGFEKYCEFKPDIVVTDIIMPKMNGIDMSKKIKEINPDAIIVALSSHSDVTFLPEIIECGFSGYLIKPIDEKKLKDQLKSFAKNIFLDKINLQQQQELISQKVILQNVMDAESNINFVTDFRNIFFANKSFLSFFHIENIEDFYEKFENIEDMFIKHDDFIHPKLMAMTEKNNDKINFGKIFYKKLKEFDDTKRLVLLLDQRIEPKSFYINVSIIDEQKGLYLISLTDITKFTEEKVKIEYKAYFDGLTQVYNRNKFDEFFYQELLRVQRYDRPLTLAILDIDHFKMFNDKHGHLIGDEVLIQIAQKINAHVRTTDLFARWGGEEFVVLFTETKQEDAIKTSENLRKYVEDLEHKVAGKVTVSFGLTQYKKGDTLESMFKRCDDALYKAKKNGRNRVECI